MKMFKLDLILNLFIVVTGIAIIITGSILFLSVKGVIDFPSKKEFNYEGYYYLTQKLTDDNLLFYIHGDSVYLDSSFSEPVGSIYKREDNSIYILYNEVEYDIDIDNTTIVKVTKDSNFEHDKISDFIAKIGEFLYKD